VSVYVILSNGSIRLKNKQTLETVRDYSKKNRNTKKFNKEFTQSSWAMSPGIAFNGGLFIMFLKQILTIRSSI